MHKHILKISTVLSLLWILSAGCSTRSQDPVEAEQAGACIVTPPKEPVACTMQYDPVCGCDGKTYGNACAARGAGVPHSTPGACGENPNN